MAYCESAQRECKYLDIINVTKGIAVTSRAMATEDRAPLNSQVEEGVERLDHTFGGTCDENHCRIVAATIMETIFQGSHIERIERFIKGEFNE